MADDILMDVKALSQFWVKNGTKKPGLILDLRPANERRRYFVTPSLIGWAQT